MRQNNKLLTLTQILAAYRAAFSLIKQLHTEDGGIGGD